MVRPIARARIPALGLLSLFLHGKQFAVSSAEQAGQIGGIFRESSYPKANLKPDLNSLVEEIERAHYS